MNKQPVITATFVKTRIEDSGSDSVMDYQVYEFSNIVDENGRKFSNKWIKKTALLVKSNLVRGKKYRIKLSDTFSDNDIALSHPIEISDGKDTYIKTGGSVRKMDINETETNLSQLNSIIDSNHLRASMTKLSKGELTESYLKNKNAQGVFFYVHYYDPQDKRKGKTQSTCGINIKGKENYVLIQKETQAEIDNDLKRIKQKYLSSVEKYFKIKTEILAPKK